MLNEVKSFIGIADTKIYDGDVAGLIQAGKADLILHGVNEGVVISDDALVTQAIKFYCKAYFKKSEASEHYLKAYEKLRTAMSFAKEYRHNV